MSNACVEKRKGRKSPYVWGVKGKGGGGDEREEENKEDVCC